MGQRRRALGHRAVSDDARVAFVTGAGAGIGRACAVALSSAGLSVAVGFGGNKEGATETASMCGGVAVEVDVSDSASVDNAFKHIEGELGAVTVLVNNAGVTGDGLLLRMKDDDWQKVLRVNLDGAFHCIRRATPGMMKARYGRIVNMGSVVGMSGSAGQVNYAAAKAGLVGLSRSVARELASRNVTCNVVAPGPIATAMTDALSAERVAAITDAVPAGRMGTPDEVAATVRFLCSDAAAYITGAVIPVDGGLGLGH
ncbi:MAG: 3-oxoacyl-[acyl-carrier protein] reductase [Actinomycetota bacterium]|jgi:3-oxoacyl-[acyl-carrier protein] reductase